jgi:hypothetical protein
MLNAGSDPCNYKLPAGCSVVRGFRSAGRSSSTGEFQYRKNFSPPGLLRSGCSGRIHRLPGLNKNLNPSQPIIVNPALMHDKQSSFWRMSWALSTWLWRSIRNIRGQARQTEILVYAPCLPRKPRFRYPGAVWQAVGGGEGCDGGEVTINLCRGLMVKTPLQPRIFDSRLIDCMNHSTKVTKNVTLCHQFIRSECHACSKLA